MYLVFLFNFEENFIYMKSYKIYKIFLNPKAFEFGNIRKNSSFNAFKNSEA